MGRPGSRSAGRCAVRPGREASGAGSPGSEGARLLALWQDAKDEVDAGINQLVAALRAEKDPDLDQIADRGLIGVTGGNTVKLMAAFLELRGATAETRPKAAGVLRKAAESYRSTVFAHPLIDLIDNNPWGVQVGMKSRLEPVLDTIIREAA